jgi:uncharacterized protein (TIGR03067 family)
MRRCALLLAVASLAFAPAPFPRQGAGDPSKEDLKKMQGTWTTLRRTYSGSPLASPGELTVVFTGDRVKYLVNGVVRTEWIMTLDAKTKPKTLDRKKVSGSGAGQILHGVYHLDGDTLTTCYYQLRGVTDQRPTDLEGAKPGECLYVMRRQKP